MKASSIHSTTQTKNQARHPHHGRALHSEPHKFYPTSRTERLISWNRRMQLLFTRQTY